MKNPNHISSLLLSPLLLACSGPSTSTTNTDISPQDTTPHTVISNGDSDTLKVQSLEGNSITIKIGCIDSSEYSQSFGPEASQKLRALLPSGATIELQEIDTDQYGHTVAEIYS